MINKKNKFFFFLLLLIFVSGANFVSAAKLPEVQYPSVPFFGVETPNEFIQKIREGTYPAEQALPLYVKYFYYLALTISGLVAAGSVIYGGFQYLISVGAPVKILAAREQISGGILGLVVLFSSYIILTTINPQLAIFNLEAAEVEKCDCAKPSSELSDYCKTYCQSIAPPAKEGAPVYIEIPLGRLVERVIKKSGEAKIVAESTKKAAESLEKLAEELKNETEKCDEECGETSPCPGGDCGSDCQGQNCSGPCSNQNKIDELSNNKIPSASQFLKLWEEQTVTAQAALRDSLFRLELAEVLMRDSFYSPLSYENFIAFEEKQVKKIEPWANVNIKYNPLTGENEGEDPATFYVREKGNEDLIEIIENIAPPIYPPGPSPIPPSPPPLPSDAVILNIPPLHQTDYLQVIDNCYSTNFTDIRAYNTISNSGCGITSLSMVLNFLGEENSPIEIAQQVTGQEYKCCLSANDNYCGSIISGLAKLAAEKYGLSYIPISFDNIQEHVRAGHPVITNCHNFGNWGWSHLSVIKGVEGGYVYFQDPYHSAGELVFSELAVDQFKCSFYYAFSQP